MSLQVRKMKPDDYQQWQPLFRGYRQFYQQADDINKEGITWQWLMNKNEPIIGIVCEALDTQKIIGFMHYEQQTSSLAGTKVGFLNDLYIDPNFRGQSAFGKLNDYLIADGKQKGWACIQWRTAENNYRARSAYDRISAKTAFLTYRIDL